MASHNQILYVVVDQSSSQPHVIAEFLNKDCAIRFCAKLYLNKAGHEYGKFLQTEYKNLTDADFEYYATRHLDDMYHNIIISRKIFDDNIQGFMSLDSTYNQNMFELINQSQLVNILVSKAKEVIAKM